MYISFSPQRRDDALELSKSSDVLTINGEDFDFGPVTEGATLPASAIDSSFFAGDVRREGGVLHVCIVLPQVIDPTPEQAFPADIPDAPDGPIPLPGDTE